MCGGTNKAQVDLPRLLGKQLKEGCGGKAVALKSGLEKKESLAVLGRSCARQNKYLSATFALPNDIFARVSRQM